MEHSAEYKRGYRAGYSAGYKKPYKKLKDFDNYVTNIADSFPSDEFICSRCGIRLKDWDSYELNDGDTYVYEYEFKFCPNCGGEIIERKDHDRI